MKKTTQKTKTLVLTMAMAIGLLLPMTMRAQSGGSDNFFSGGSDNYQNRGGEAIQNQNFGNDNFGPASDNSVEAPIGSGIIILVAACAGYVALKKKED